jgi:hypothetical protein
MVILSGKIMVSTVQNLQRHSMNTGWFKEFRSWIMIIPSILGSITFYNQPTGVLNTIQPT